MRPRAPVVRNRPGRALPPAAWLLGLAAWLPACTANPPPATAVDQLVRASMALRGTRPSLADLNAVLENPDAADALAATYADGPDFGATLRDLHAADLLLRSDANHLPAAGTLAAMDRDVLSRAVLEEPLRLVEWVVLTDRPYTDIVTTDVVLADATVAAVWGLARDPAAEGWAPTTWGDGRPAAGILASAGLWFRHASNGENQNRARANRLARALVCQDYLVTDVPLDELAFADAREAEDAVRTLPQCTGCHATLDPIASFLYGFADMPTNSTVSASCEAGGECYPLASWRPDRVGEWEAVGMPAPAWFGAPGESLGDLGAAIAADPRFATCAARRFAGWMRHVPAADIPASEADALAADFVAGGWNARELARAVVADTPLRDAGPLAIRPEQLSRTLADLTGWTWTDEAGADLLATADDGWRGLVGGADDYYVTRPDDTMTPTKALVMARAAEQAAAHVVAADLAQPDPSARHLLHAVDADTTAEDDVRAQLTTLHLRVLGEVVATDDTPVDESWLLWHDVHAAGGTPADAWVVVLAAMLQDGRIAWY